MSCIRLLVGLQIKRKKEQKNIVEPINGYEFLVASANSEHKISKEINIVARMSGKETNSQSEWS